MTQPPCTALVLLMRGLDPLVVPRRVGLTWGLPGDRVRPGEDPRAAAVRGLREETGIAIDPDSLQELYHAEGLVVTYLAHDSGSEPDEGRAYWGPWVALTGGGNAFPVHSPYLTAVCEAWAAKEGQAKIDVEIAEMIRSGFWALLSFGRI